MAKKVSKGHPHTGQGFQTTHLVDGVNERKENFDEFTEIFSKIVSENFRVGETFRHGN